MVDTERAEILKSLEPLFERAGRESLWFYNAYSGLWFSPDELRAEHKLGHFVWGAANWDLRRPADRVEQLECEVTWATKSLDEFIARVRRWEAPVSI